MKLLVWNCRGLGSPRAIRDLCSLVKATNPQIIGLQETKLDVRRMEQVRLKLGFGGCFVVPARRASGGLAVLWKREVNVNVQSYSTYHIDFLVKDRMPTRCTLFYGSPVAHNRKHSWNLLRQLALIGSEPWCVIGDFNDILCKSETTKFSYSKCVYMNFFRQAVQDCGLFDIGFKGDKYTYTNKRRGLHECKSRLDRVLANHEWIRRFPNATNNHLFAHTSDHLVLLLSLDRCNSEQRKLFRFENMWLRDVDFHEVVNKGWEGVAGKDQFLENKLETLKHSITRWNRKTFGNVHDQLKVKRLRLQELRQAPRNEEVKQQEESLVAEIDEWLYREEILWKQRSKITWLEEGDNNTKMFHNFANGRQRRNDIRSLLSNDGVHIEDQLMMKKQIADHFELMFRRKLAISYDQLQANINCVPRIVSQCHNDMLTAQFTPEEVTRAVYQMHPCKAPGVDGYNPAFYQHFWHIVGEDVIKDCLQFLNEGKLNKEANATMIVLIPKVKSALKITDYRPISLLGVKMRIISKVMANRLRKIIHQIISPEQSAFIPDRIITDNIILSHEVFHCIRNVQKTRKKIYGSLKIDIAKAYDTIDWEFLEAILYRLGFADGWISRIMQIVTSVTYIVKVNNDFTDVIYPQRGIRQGDPISPYLFILCTEFFSALMLWYRQRGLLEGIKICRRAVPISHLLFADDSLIFLQVTQDSIIMLKKLLSEFGDTTGLHINVEKSAMMVSKNATQRILMQIRAILGVKTVQDHATYLGLPTVVHKQHVQQFQSILDKMRNKTEDWRHRTLSAGGKHILIQSVLNAIPQYWLSCFLLPQTVINQIHALINNYWWDQSGKKRGVHWTNATVLKEKRDEGGLGFYDFKHLNLAFIAKQCWRILRNEDALIAKVLKAKYYPNGNLLNATNKQGASHVWKALIQSVPMLRKGCTVEGDRIRWHENSTGIFDIKSAYILSKKMQEESKPNVCEQSYKRKIHKMWKCIWRMSVPRKLKLFIWRLYHSAIPTGWQKWKRNMKDNVKCPICLCVLEDDAHPFIKCWWSKALWKEMSIDFMNQFEECNKMADVIFLAVEKCRPDEFTLFTVTWWYIWYHRNLVAHGGHLSSPKYIKQRIERMLTDFSSRKQQGYLNIAADGLVWRKPSKGFIKINCDGSWDMNNQHGSCAAVARDDEGLVTGIRMKYIEQCYTVDEAELNGLCEGMKMARQLSLMNVIFEVDSLNVAKVVNWMFDLHIRDASILQDIMEALKMFKNWKVLCTRREANMVADSLARRALNEKMNWHRLDALIKDDNLILLL